MWVTSARKSVRYCNKRNMDRHREVPFICLLNTRPFSMAFSLLHYLFPTDPNNGNTLPTSIHQHLFVPQSGPKQLPLYNKGLL